MKIVLSIITVLAFLIGASAAIVYSCLHLFYPAPDTENLYLLTILVSMPVAWLGLFLRMRLDFLETQKNRKNPETVL